ncbi:DUF305 domain-containing protein [Amycolatopsis thermoflava]|uniref:Uncharacterized protein (DUF305 family) n=1 Tax=Amycolatopsis thermoflava TaxID=84480 RepID=A0A3N2GZ97_9PSEU|nr:DUF305 domain-containing protein [Amycolatopsis thermoflava]ROS41439.1 uncharacterized protein (DUF305 family) [Amycolatopsis thermoflava]
MRKTMFVGGFVLAAALLAGCGAGSQSHESHGTTTTAAEQQAGHNQADVDFARMMIPHHEGALEMAGLAPGRSTDQRVLDLAARIQRAQDPEIQQMRGWLTQWGAPATPMDHSMPGEMGHDDMTALEHATGVEFDRQFLRMMIEHHQGAIEMAQTELAEGSNADAKALAQRIIDSQQAEIAEMQAMLA